MQDTYFKILTEFCDRKLNSWLAHYLTHDDYHYLVEPGVAHLILGVRDWNLAVGIRKKLAEVTDQ